MALSSKELAAALQRHADSHGGIINPDVVVREATNPAHELHGEYIWDDAKAAHIQRVEHTRSLIRSVKIEVKTTTHDLCVVAYVRDPSLPSREAGYVSLPSLVGQAERTATALTYEFGRAAAALRRARDIALALGEAEQADIEAALVAVETAAGIVTKLRMSA